MNFFEQVKNNFKQQGVLTQIILVNVAVFLTVNVVGSMAHLIDHGHNRLVDFLGMPLSGFEFLTKFWTIFTFMFTHTGLGHIFWNMVNFYFLSQVFLTIMGQRAMLYLYVMSGVMGGAVLMIVALLFPESFNGGHTYLIGASASVLGIGAVMAVYAPNYKVFLFGMLEMPYKYFYLGLFAITTLLDPSENTGGKISHVGGALFGLIYGYYLKRGTDLFNFSFRVKRKTNLTIVSDNRPTSNTTRRKQPEEAHTMDELLDKISKSGYDSLTKSEKEELFRLSQRN